MNLRHRIILLGMMGGGGPAEPVLGLHVRLDNATLAATGEVTISGELASTLDDATLAGSGEVEIAGSLAVTLDDCTLAATGEQYMRVVFPESIVYPIDPFHLRRNMTGESINRAWASVIQAGTRRVASLRSDGYGANAATWCASLSGVSHAYADLTAGAHTSTEVATAWATAMTGLGCTGLTVESPATIAGVSYCAVRVPLGSGKLVSSPISTDETARGMRGAQRAGTATPFGTGVGIDAQSYASMGAGISVHIARRNANARRITGVYCLDVTGSGTIRLAVSSGPAYSTTPTAFTMVEGVSQASGVIRLLRLREPIAEPTNPWVSFVGPGGGGANTVGYRPQSANPPGVGDYTPGEQLLSNGSVTDPTVRMSTGGTGDATYATGGSYTHGSEIGPFTVHPVMGYLYEDADGSGDYGDQAGFETWIGYHGAYDFGSPTTGTPAVIRDITETFRRPIVHACEWIGWRAAYADNAADEDTGIWGYDWTGITIAAAPAVGTIEQIADIGPAGFSAGAGYKTHLLASTVALAANSILGVLANHGNDDGVTPADTIATLYDDGSDDGYLSRWIDDGDTWCDHMTLGGGGYQAAAQYLTTTSGDMVVGDPSATQPDPLDANAADSLPTNLWREAALVARAGLS